MATEVSDLLANTVERLCELYPSLNVAPVTHRFAVADRDIYTIISVDDGTDLDGAQLSQVDRMTGLLCVDLPFRAVLTWNLIGRPRGHGEYSPAGYWQGDFIGSQDAAYSLWAWTREYEFIDGATGAVRPQYCRRLGPDELEKLDQEALLMDLHAFRWEIGWIAPVQISSRWQWRGTGLFEGPPTEPYLKRMDRLFLRGDLDDTSPPRQVIPDGTHIEVVEHFDEDDFDGGDFDAA